jgi:hypothetical protein
VYRTLSEGELRLFPAVVDRVALFLSSLSIVSLVLGGVLPDSHRVVLVEFRFRSVLRVRHLLRDQLPLPQHGATVARTRHTSQWTTGYTIR